MADLLKNKKIKLQYRENIEPQEVLLDSLALKKEEELGISKRRFEVPLLDKTGWIFYAGFLMLMALLFIKTIELQLFANQRFSALAERNVYKTYPIRTARGVIYDQTGKQLVFNQSSFDLVFEKNYPSQSFKEEERAILEAAKIILDDPKEVKKRIDDSATADVLVKENVSPEMLLVLETKINNHQLSGFRLEENAVRDYRDGPAFSHLLGYTAKVNEEEYRSFGGYSITDYIGKVGIEKSYEEILRGNPGMLKVKKDAPGNKLSETVMAEPKPGKSLLLWLDADLQKKLTAEVETVLRALGSYKAAAVAMDPKTGGILALVSLPSFDNNLLSQSGDPAAVKKLLTDPREPLFNRAISGAYPTGSTVKPLIAAAALEEKLISADKEIYDPGYILVPNPWDSDKPSKFLDWMVHGLVDLKKAIAVSCNVYFYTVGGGYGDQEGLGPTRIKKYLELFGWGKKTGIALLGEKNGLIPDPAWKKNHFENNFDKIWRDGDTYNLSIGQGYLLATPIQVATAFSAIANGGKLLKPQVVKKIIETAAGLTPEGAEIGPEIVRENFIDGKNLRIVREGMRDGVIYGSSAMLNSLPVKAAAKTGTAQTSKPGYYDNWVTVFAPYDDPRLVLTVVIEDVKDVQVAALPVAENVLEWYFSNESLK